MNLFLMVAAAMVAYAIGFFVSRHAQALGLVVVPNHRSSHTLPTPQSGGAGMVVAGSLFGMMLYPDAWPVLLLGLLLALIGLRDDMHHVPARWRFLAQFMAVVSLLVMVALPYPIWLIALVAIGAVWWINLFNFMDGTDGLAATQAIVMLGSAAAMIGWQQPVLMQHPGWLMMVLVAAAAFGFLLLNWPPARVFMGDVGSLYLAFMILALGLGSVHAGWLEPAVWLILGAAFVSDASVTLVTRVLRGQRWYEAHRSHAYQILAVRWQSHRRVVWLLLAMNFVVLLPLAVLVQAGDINPVVGVLAAYVPILLAARMVGAGRA